jgi:hypothetical protein
VVAHSDIFSKEKMQAYTASPSGSGQNSGGTFNTNGSV